MKYLVLGNWVIKVLVLFYISYQNKHWIKYLKLMYVPNIYIDY